MLTTLAAAVLLGLASSVHCVAMCGPLVLAGCAGGKGGGRATLGYLGGRLVSYAAVGALAGSIGGPVVVAASTSREVRITIGWILALSVAWVAIRWLGKPSTTNLVSLRAKPASPSKFQRWLVRWVPAKGIGLGLATGLFPCGALASALVVAATTGSAHGGALAMMAFALASAPALLAVALFGKGAIAWLGNRAWVNKARPVMAVALLGVAGWLGIAPMWKAHHPAQGAHCSCETQSVAPHAETATHD